MKMGYFARRTLVPAVMDWVHTSKLNKHLPADCEFIKQTSDGYLDINLYHLDEGYLGKFVHRDIWKYSDAFTKQVTPVIKMWCIKCNMHEAVIKLKLISRGIAYNEVKVSATWEELKNYHNT